MSPLLVGLAPEIGEDVATCKTAANLACDAAFLRSRYAVSAAQKQSARSHNPLAHRWGVAPGVRGGLGESESRRGPAAVVPNAI